jgi:hypothetical protein
MTGAGEHDAFGVSGIIRVSQRTSGDTTRQLV